VRGRHLKLRQDKWPLGSSITGSVAVYCVG
jgi:hypothetical protein